MCQQDPYFIELADGSWIDLLSVGRFFPEENPDGEWQLWVEAPSLWTEENKDGRHLLKRNIYKHQDSARKAMKLWLTNLGLKYSAARDAS